MKRYVRLTNSIEEIVKESHCYYSPQPKCWHLKDHYLIKEDDKDFKKYRFSDSIEELCDKFVWIDDEYQRGFICNIEFAKNCTKSHIGKLYGDSKFIFGAIWTDKGLIYVAKMNEKGEFELL